jgi:hypothetical protein
VTVLTRTLLITTAGFWMALPLAAQEPSANQKLADAIAEQLRQSPSLHQYTIDVRFRGGTAELNGTVADEPQHEEVLRIASGVAGVERVVDHVVSADPNTLKPVQAVVPPVINPSTNMPTRLGMNSPVDGQPHGGMPGYYDPSGHGMPGNGYPGYGPNYYSGPMPNFGVEPVPQSQAGTPGPYDLNPPKMPPYAWPTYAPYNNYSRVAYPTLYPPQSWPFIGPLYPFPKVPLGWRAVKLEWQDGHWWLSRYATPHDWWMLKYW